MMVLGDSNSPRGETAIEGGPALETATAASLVRDSSAPPERVRRVLNDLTIAGLRELGLPLFESAFLATFGDRWDRSKVRRVAAAANRSWLWGGWQWRAFVRDLREGPGGRSTDGESAPTEPDPDRVGG
jgi:hypothetical protein